MGKGKQLLLFNQPNLNINRIQKEQMYLSVQESELNRDEILDLMNVLADRYGVRLMRGNGRKLTKSMFEKWINVNAMEHIPPHNSVIIFCWAIQDNRAILVTLVPLGIVGIEGDDILMLEWAKEFHMVKAAKKKMRKLELEL